jgi:stearoyl-CoA desaturase (delta-9 desaturase)
MHWVLGIVVGLLTAQLGILVTSVYLHRGVAHKALTVHPAVAMFCRVFIWIATGMRPREWVAVHRRHHAATDTPDDPHSPAVVGFWRVQLANAALYRRRARDGETVPKYGRDVPTDRLDKWFFDRAWLGLGIGVTLLCLLLGWQTGLLASVVHAVAYLGLSGAVNAVGHTIGRRPYPNSATNGQILALITSGEGLHNNHHAAPTSARFSLARGQFDPGYLAVRILTTFRLATIRHDDVKLKRAA